MKRIVLVAFPLLLVAAALALAAPAAEQGAQGAATDLGFNATGLPIVTKPVTLTAVVLKDVKHAAFKDMEVFQRMEKETGVTIAWNEIPQANFEEKKNLILASNDLPDIFMHGVTDSDLLRYSGQGVFVALDPYITKYAPRIQELFKNRPDIKNYVTTPDGHVYVLPRIQELAHRVNPDNWFLNKTWLAKLGLQAPTTPEALQQVLKAFRERDPNGNGKKDEIPMSFLYPGHAVRSSGMNSLFGAFGTLDDPMDHVMVDGSKKAYFTANNDNYRAAIKYLAGLYGQGLIDAEAFTHDRKQYNAKGKTADVLYGSFFAWFDEEVVGDARAKADYMPLPPLKGPGGRQMWNYDPTSVLARQNFVVTNKNKYPEVSIRWADQCYDWKTSYELVYGTWGINIKQEGDKVIQLPSPVGLTGDEFRYLHSPAYTTPFALYEKDFKNLQLTENHVRKFARLDMYRQFFPRLDEVYPRVFFLQAEEDELAILRTDLRDYVHQMTAKWIIGSSSVDADWDGYHKQLARIGLPRYLELYQKALDRYYK